MNKLVALALPAFLLGACMEAEPSRDDVGQRDSELLNPDLFPTGRGGGVVHQFAGQGGGNVAISYHGGPVMTGTTHIYYIWYGDWSGNNASFILQDLASNIGGSPYFNINTTYYDGAGTHVSNSVTWAGESAVAYPHGTWLSYADVLDVVTGEITLGHLPSDTSGVYFVLTSSDVTVTLNGAANDTSGFCVSNCGWHTHASILGSDIKYSFIGNAERCPASCSAQTVSPNGNLGADAMASIIAHELEEAVTDPDLNAWFDARGYENADKCAWTYGTTATTATGAKYNMTLGNRDFLIQQNWINAKKGSCAKAF